MPLVDRRYAEALVNISAQGGVIDVYQQEFQSIVDIFNNQLDFKLFLLNPKVEINAKKEVIKKLFDNKVRPEMLNFLMLLIDKGRIRFLPGILEEFIKLADKKRNIINMTIISAGPLADKQIDDIKTKYKKVYNTSSIKVNVEIDKSLIGGVMIKIGDKVVDGSIKGRLESLKELLVR